MRATTNSKVLAINCFHRNITGLVRFSAALGLLLLTWFWLANPVLAENTTNVFQLRAQKAYEVARDAYRAAPQNDEAVWRYGRAIFDLAEFAKNDDAREELALEGIAVCRALVTRSPRHAAGHYYLGMNLGQLARTKTLGALSIVREMESVFKRSAELDNKVHYSGADRCLGILYLEAPGWPTSIGSKSKARLHLQRCVELSPEYPDNHLELMEAYVEWRDTKALQKAAKAYEELLPQAHETFTGERWEENWLDWNKRWQAIQNKLRK
jgi:tetratricopeptide (TPR) repeat protein